MGLFDKLKSLVSDDKKTLASLKSWRRCLVKLST